MTMTEKQKRMKEIVKKFQQYVDTYSSQRYYKDYCDETFIHDMLYGVAISIDKKYEWRSGYKKFIKDIIIPELKKY